ncbi:MAG: ATP-binding cassette domain-containing protein [Anaerolineae bacterium]
MNQRRDDGAAIEARGLVKWYGDEVLAVDGLDLAIPANQIYGLLGPNGAGKTTTISILTTLLEPTAGDAKVLGLDVVKQASNVRQQIGVTFQEMVLDDELTGYQVMDYHGRLYRMGKAERRSKIAELLSLVELEEAAERKAKTYSGGMKRRLELARALMTTPEVLFLDEPTLGLDPQTRARIWDYLRTLKQETGMTLLLTTHYMDEAEELADTVGILDRGTLVAEGAPQELIEQMGADTIHVIGAGERDQFVEKVRALPFVQAVDVGRTVIQIGVDSGSKRLGEIISQARGSAFAVQDITVSKPSLGDVFLKVTGRRLRDTDSNQTQHRMLLIS